MRGKAALWLRRALGVGLLLGVWQLASLCFSPLVLPPVPQVAGTLAWLIREPDFWPTVGTTLLRLALGLGIGIAVGSILGLLFGLCQTGGCGGAVHPCAPVGAAGMLGCAGSGMVWV